MAELLEKKSRARGLPMAVSFAILLMLVAWAGSSTVQRWERGLKEDRVIYRALAYARAGARLTEAGYGQVTPNLVAYGNAVGESAAASDVLRQVVLRRGKTRKIGSKVIRKPASALWSMHGQTGALADVDRALSQKATKITERFSTAEADGEDSPLRLLLEVSDHEPGWFRVAAYAPVMVDGKPVGMAGALVRVKNPTTQVPMTLWWMALAIALAAAGAFMAFPRRGRWVLLVAGGVTVAAALSWLPARVAEVKTSHMAQRAADMLEVQGYADTLAPVALVSPVPAREPWSMDGALRLERTPGEASSHAFLDGADRVGGPGASVHLHADAKAALSGRLPLGWVLWALGGGLLLMLCTAPLGRLLAGVFSEPGTYAYTAPAVLGLLVLVFFPFITGMGLSFYHYDKDGQTYDFVGMGNFLEILHPAAGSDINFWWTLGVTILWTVSNVFLHVTIGLALAMVLNRPKLRGRKFYRTLLILPWAVPNYITALMWRAMFEEHGAVNSIISGLGFAAVPWFGADFWSNFIPCLVANVWLGFPFMMVVSLGALQSIPGGLYEAAALDGASKWQQFRNVTLPLIKPALLPSVILGVIWTFNMFNIIYLVSGGNGGTEILITEAYDAFNIDKRYGYAAAYAVLIFGVLLTYTLVTNRVTKATEGAMG